MLNTIASLTSDISSRLSGNPVALMLANKFLVTSCSIIDSLLTRIESFTKSCNMRDNRRQNILGCSYAPMFVAILKNFEKFDLLTKLPLTYLALQIVLDHIFGLWSSHIAFRLAL